MTGWHTGRDKILQKKKTLLTSQKEGQVVLFTEVWVSVGSAVSTRQLMAFQTTPGIKPLPKEGWYCFDLVISDRFALIWTALLRYSLRHLTSWFIVSSVSQFYLTPASGGAGIAPACCHGCKTNLCGMKKDLPWSPAQRAAYLCTVWTTCRNLTTGEWKHAILRDLLTDQEQEGRGEKKLMHMKTQRPSAWQYAIYSAFILTIFSKPVAQLSFWLWNDLKCRGQVRFRTRY